MIAVDSPELPKHLLDRTTLVSGTMFAPFTSEMVVWDLGKCAMSSADNENRRVRVSVVGLRVIEKVAVDFTGLCDKFLRGRSSHEGIYLERLFGVSWR